MDFHLTTVTNWLTLPRKGAQDAESPGLLADYRQTLEEDFRAYDPGFRITKWLGSGGFCDVFLVPNVHVAGKGVQDVVLRVLRPALYNSDKPMVNNRVVKTFLAEIFYNTYLTSQNVRNVVKIFDYGHLHNRRYFTMMEYVDGPNFLDLIPQKPKDVKDLMRRIVFINAVAGVVGELHFRGVIHRDLKPSNIIVRGWEPFITDLGAARWAYVKDDVGDEHLTVLGTPSHMSYEQHDGDYYKVDHRTDIFSLACMAAFAFTGVHPFAEREPVDFRKDGMGALSAVEPVVPDIPFRKGVKLRAYLLRCMDRSVDKRPNSMVEFQHALNTWILEA
jgi:serine/threonine protein kinase